MITKVGDKLNAIARFFCSSSDSIETWPTGYGAGSLMTVIDDTTGDVTAEYVYTGEEWARRPQSDVDVEFDSGAIVDALSPLATDDKLDAVLTALSSLATEGKLNAVLTALTTLATTALTTLATDDKLDAVLTALTPLATEGKLNAVLTALSPLATDNKLESVINAIRSIDNRPYITKGTVSGARFDSEEGASYISDYLSNFDGFTGGMISITAHDHYGNLYEFIRPIVKTSGHRLYYSPPLVDAQSAIFQITPEGPADGFIILKMREPGEMGNGCKIVFLHTSNDTGADTIEWRDWGPEDEDELIMYDDWDSLMYGRGLFVTVDSDEDGNPRALTAESLAALIEETPDVSQIIEVTRMDPGELNIISTDPNPERVAKNFRYGKNVLTAKHGDPYTLLSLTTSPTTPAEPVEEKGAEIDYAARYNETRKKWYVKVTVDGEDLDADSINEIWTIKKAGQELDEPQKLTPDADKVLWLPVAGEDGVLYAEKDGEYAYKVVRKDGSEYIFSFTYDSSEVTGLPEPVEE
jgi:hypothetical protein